jgi:hypothetical protein
MKAASSPKPVALGNFRQRARLYQLAAVVADAPGDVATFRDLATMLEQIRRILLERRRDADRFGHGRAAGRPRCMTYTRER